MHLERLEFDELFRDLLNQLDNYPALEKHLLADWISPSNDGQSQGEQLRQLVLTEINSLRPNTAQISEREPKQRPFLILHKRYIEGKSPASVAAELFIGDRQMRRDHNKALDSLAERFWRHHIQPRLSEQPDPPAEAPAATQFESHPQALDLLQTIQGVAQTLQPRFASEEAELQLELPALPRRVLADRVILRQVIIGLLNFGLHVQNNGLVALSAGLQAAEVWLDVIFQVESNWQSLRLEALPRLQKTTLEWLPAIQARLEENSPQPGLAGECRLRLFLPTAPAQALLVIDDQPATVRLFQRYLSQTDYEVIGLSDPEQALSNAARLQPYAITLDVMMPNLDGWELLQALKLDPRTRHIPVIVCSALDAPELAQSLEAAAFLKKPVVQKDLLAALAALT